MSRIIYQAVGWVIVCYVGYHLFVFIFPYLLWVFAAIGAFALLEEHQRNKNRWK